MNRDQLFVRTLQDLEGKLQSKDEYDILLIAALLRKLLLDASPLVDQANRSRKLKITYVINDRQPPPEASFWSVEDGLDPDTSVPGSLKPVELNKDAFLSRTVLKCSGHCIKIKELIDQLANIEGGVHAGVAREEASKALAQLMAHLGIGGLPAGYRLMCAIGRIVVKGLAPLKEQITTQ